MSGVGVPELRVDLPSLSGAQYRMTSLSSAADDFVRAFGEAFDDYLGDWAEAIRRHIVEGVSLRR